jgi:hypothetical protein
MTIEQLQQQAQLSFQFEVAKTALQARMEDRLAVSYREGFFTVTKEQINFLDLLGNQEVVLIDSYKTPIKINAHELLALMFQRYHEIMNEWLEEYNKLSKIRSAKNV